MKRIQITVFIFLFSIGLFAQPISGVKTIPGDYATISAAISALNTNGTTSPGVTYNIASGYTENEYTNTSQWVINTTTSNATAPIVFQKTPGGATNPKIFVSGGASTSDGGIIIAGTDYITFDGIDIQANNTVEWGYGLVKKSNVAPFDGCQNVVIKNCNIAMDWTNSYVTVGIYCGNHIPGNTSSLIITATSDATNDCQFYSNTISNVSIGIAVHGYNAASPYSLYNQNFDIGVSGANTISNFATATPSGVYVDYTNNVNISNNTISSAALGSGPGGMRGIYLGNSSKSSATVSGNTISLDFGGSYEGLYGIYSVFGGSGTTNTVNITNNTIQNCSYSYASSGAFYGIYNYYSNIPGTLNINNNTIHGATIPGSGYLMGISTGGAININVNHNIIYDLHKTAFANAYGIEAGTGILVMHDNLIHDISISTGTGLLYGILDNSSPTNENYYNNTIYNLVHSGTGNVFGMNFYTTSGTRNTYSNTIHTLSSAGGTVTGMYHSASTPTIYKNTIYDLTSTTATGMVNGITIDGGSNAYLYNNFISDLKTPAATGTNAIRGIYKNAGSTLYCYNNTIYLNASSTSTTTFGSSGIYAETNWGIELKNNLIVNTSTPVFVTGPSYTVAYRRSSTSISTYSTSSNNNCFYAGMPGTNNLIYHDGTNGDQSVVLFKARVSPRESNSFSENPTFVDAAANNIHLNLSTPTALESSGLRITSPIAITTDYDGETRWGETGYSGSGTSTDVGADEADFIGLPSMAYLSSTTIQHTGYVFSGNTDQLIISVKITTDGGSTPLTLTQLTLNSNGTTDIADINTVPAKVYYTGDAPNFVTGILFGSTTPTMANYSVNGSQILSTGDNYFWLVFDVTQTATTDHLIDAECVSMVISGITRVPSITAPVGYRTILGPMNGTYLVGIANSFPNFATLTEAVTNINNRGVMGPVTFLLTNSGLVPYSASYGETIPIVVNEIPLASATNTITIKPAVGISSIITGNSSTAIFEINGTDYFSIDGSNNGSSSRDLTIENTSTGNWSAALQVLSGASSLGAKYFTVKNCKIIGGSPGNNNSYTYAFSAGSTVGVSGADNDNMTIDNNEFSRAFYGLYIGGTTSGVMDNLLCTNNIIGSFDANYYCGNVGLYLNNVAGTVSQNVINGVVSSVTSTFGIYVGAGTRNMTISRNNIHAVKGTIGSTYCGTGMFINLASSGNNVTICNNILYDITGDGSSNLSSYGTAGIKITGISTDVKIYHNTISLSGYISHVTTNDLSTDIYVGSSVSQIDIRNNILSNSIENLTGDSKAYSMYIAGSANVLNNLDYNDYFVYGIEGILGYLGGDKLSIETWQTASGRDLQSISSSPNLNTLPSLVPYPGSVVLDACPSVSITDDFSGITRTVPTSMGAYELGSDVSEPVISYIELDNTLLLTDRTLTVTITDAFGSVPQSGSGLPRLYWQINGNPYSIAIGSWISGDTFQFVFGAGASMGNTISYFVVAQDNEASPNVGCYPSSGASGYSTDPPACITPPTSPSSYTIVQGLSGSINIPGDYASLTGATGLFADINAKVLTGNLVVNIVGNTTEDGSTALNKINVADPSFNLTIQGNGSMHTISGNYSGALIRFNGADNVRITGNSLLTFSNTITSNATVFNLSNSSNNNIIDGCFISTGAVQYSSNYAISINGACNNNIIRNDSISKCDYGIYLDGTYWNQASGNSIYGNNIGSNTASNYVRQNGIYAKYQNNLLLQGNYIYNVISNQSPQAIYLEGVTNSVIEKNYIRDIVYNGANYLGASGITNKAINADPNIIIRNNVIRKISGLGGSPNTGDNNTIPAGIKLFGNSNAGIYIYYNSIYMTPDPVYGIFYNNEWFTALEIGANVSGIHLENNILQNSVGERSGSSLISYGYSIYCKSATTPFTSINRNIYYSTNYDNNYVGLAGTASPPTNNMNLTSWKTFTGQDAQSINADPLFTSVTNLIPSAGSPALGAGVPVGSISADFTGASRSYATPTIGAYEVNNGPTAIDWANLQSPATATIDEGSTISITARVYEPGVTNAAGQGAGIQVWIGWNGTNTDPSTWTNWTLANYSTDVASTDEYIASIGASLAPGTYYIASRVLLSGGNNQYGGYRYDGGGFWDGVAFISSVVTVNQVFINKSIDVHAFLEGPFDGASGLMNTTLNDNGHLPLLQPYNISPWYYAGTESVVAIPANVVDWVLIELRDAPSPAQASPATTLTGWPKAFFIKSDGSIVGLDGVTSPTIGNPVISDNLYVVIYHRNHIAIMSNTGMIMTGNSYGYDFTSAITQAYGDNAGYKELGAGSGIFGMVAGDADGSGDVSGLDYSAWATDFGNPGYLRSDIDNDGDVSGLDFSKWATNFGIANPILISNKLIKFKSQVPEKK
ncbi:MAG: hypothetical protein CVT99_15765 [Bacteroidetes bacterium HGW-Bacteroidetes-16]|jgi:hypothetical protein|nr:MAG: hypothetical protein CVT99_15765 [Bacteroidetes bacterium HGW-Bacteroidetes-16]